MSSPTRLSKAAHIKNLDIVITLLAHMTRPLDNRLNASACANVYSEFLDRPELISAFEKRCKERKLAFLALNTTTLNLLLGSVHPDAEQTKAVRHIKLILDLGSVNVNQDVSYPTPSFHCKSGTLIHVAAIRGLEKLVRLLLTAPSIDLDRKAVIETKHCSDTHLKYITEELQGRARAAAFSLTSTLKPEPCGGFYLYSEYDILTLIMMATLKRRTVTKEYVNIFKLFLAAGVNNDLALQYLKEYKSPILDPFRTLLNNDKRLFPCASQTSLHPNSERTIS